MCLRSLRRIPNWRIPNWWSRSLVPLALASASATSLAHLNQSSYPSISQSSALDNLTTDYDERHFHGKPQNSFHKSVNICDVVVFPRSEEEVSKILKSCNQYKVPIVPYGGATSIEGHTLAPKGDVCIDMSLKKRVKALHVEDMDVLVEPGIGWQELNEQVEQYGLFFPLDPDRNTKGMPCLTIGDSRIGQNTETHKALITIRNGSRKMILLGHLEIIQLTKPRTGPLFVEIYCMKPLLSLLLFPTSV
ncbi:unnamed protein product [Eruca vesicaria subsp. sativa]|uniref:FAD-binding PCMH-type domain-containing protein n=1 Tax=Eruca vesicaria subsp. sativa TaxID=29727 RepID=A0ABC8KYA6_ERUVS|nr:unnamed protein product [Eruca vesicaria subsp. sativa]